MCYLYSGFPYTPSSALLLFLFNQGPLILFLLLVRSDVKPQHLFNKTYNNYYPFNFKLLLIVLEMLDYF